MHAYVHVAVVDPHLLPQLSADVRQPLLAVEAHGLQTSVAQHFDDLCVFCHMLSESCVFFGVPPVEWQLRVLLTLALLFECEFALFIVILCREEIVRQLCRASLPCGRSFVMAYRSFPFSCFSVVACVSRVPAMRVRCEMDRLAYTTLSLVLRHVGLLCMRLCSFWWKWMRCARPDDEGSLPNQGGRGGARGGGRTKSGKTSLCDANM